MVLPQPEHHAVRVLAAQLQGVLLPHLVLPAAAPPPLAPVEAAKEAVAPGHLEKHGERVSKTLLDST